MVVEMTSVPPRLDSGLKVNIRKRLGPVFSLEVEFVAESGITVLFGASGAGKTTILDLIAGTRVPDEGTIRTAAAILYDSSKDVCLPIWERRVGYVFQDLALFPHLSALENVEYGMRGLEGEERRRRSAEILEAFNVQALKDRMPDDLSGGERQRIALARALVMDPAVLMLDEPLSALDRKTKSSIIRDIRCWNEEHKIPILYVTHNQDEVYALGHRVIALENGKVIAQGTPHEVLRVPRLETIAALSGIENIFDVVVSSIHAERGTMSCRVSGAQVQIEAPMVKAEVGSRLRLGVRAGDILLATEPPRGLSARNILHGKLIRLERRDVMISASVSCGVQLEVHLTLAAQESLGLEEQKGVWLVWKTHSCHLMSAEP